MKSLTFTLLALSIAQHSSICSAYPSSQSYGDNVPVEKRIAPVVLGQASTYGAVGATTLTSTGNTVITGDVGVYPGTSITGFPPGIITGTNSTESPAARAEAACLSA